MTLDEAVQALIPVAQVNEARRELVRELSLCRGDETRVLFELVCLHVLAVHFGIVQIFAEEPHRLAGLIEAYHQYWSTYSDAVAVSYSEEAYRRLPRYREAVRRSEVSGSGLEVGRVFADLCGLESGNLAALGANAFTRIVEQTAAMLASWDIDPPEPRLDVA